MKRRHLPARLLAGVLGTALVAAGAIPGAAVSATADSTLPWMNTRLSPQMRASLLVSAMTLEQKIEQLHGQPGPVPEVPECGSNAGRHIPGIPALDIPTFRITNGPVGLGQGDCVPTDPATALPDSMGMAASFDTSLAGAYGNLLGTEAATLGLQSLEGPGMDMARVGEGGRNFEYLGEDPYLAGSMAASEIKGVQSHGVMAMAKHFVLNDQETNRTTVSAVVDDRTLHEIYLQPFQMAVQQGHVASVMCAYNRVGPNFNCDNDYTLSTVLRDQWGFKGYVQSDFGATHSTATSLNNGEDLEMSTPVFYTEPAITAALANGTLTVAAIDNALRLRYTQMFVFGDFDRPITHNPVNVAAGAATAEQVEEQSAVLLKNSGSLLPLNASNVGSIALIGQQTFAGQAVTGGGGSSQVLPATTVSPLQGLQNTLSQLGSSATVSQFIVNSNNSNLAGAVAAAKAANVVVLEAGVITSEGSDRPNLSLPSNQDAMISAIAAANPNTVLVLKDGDPVLMPWISQVPAVMEAWFPGEEDGNAIAQLLFGQANPSGKLPVTYPVSAAQTPTDTQQQWPGVTVNGIPTVTYSEGLEMGYRWYTAQHITPLFPFGFGLSYTTFKFSNLQVTPDLTPEGTVKVTADITNTGSRDGSEVAQVYVGDPPSAGEPPEQLEGFTKVSLAPGQTKQVSLTLVQRAFSTWDTTAQEFTTADGTYKIMVGDSSANLPLQATTQIRKTLGTQSVQFSAPSVVNAGSTANVTTTFANTGDFAASGVEVKLQVPAGWTATATSPSRLPLVGAHSSRPVTWHVTVPAGASPGSFTLKGTATFSGARTGKVVSTASVDVPFSSLAAAFDNNGITDDSDPGAGGIAASGDAYSAEALASAGVAPGPLTYNGVTFTWPSGTGVPTDVEADGQVISMSGSGSSLDFLGAGVSGTQGGTGTVYYTDGSTSTFSLSFDDWWHPAATDQVVATMPYLNGPSGKITQANALYFGSVPITAGKTVQAVKLPATAASPNPGLHVFAMTVG